MGRPEHIRAVVFDFDGTLCDTEGFNIAGCRRVFAQMGADVPLEVVRTLTGKDDRVTVPPILERFGARGGYDDYERLCDGNYRTYAEAPLVPEPGAVELVERLRARGVRTGIASMTRPRCVLTALNRLGLVHLFDALVLGDMVEHKKPAPDPFLLALGYLGVAPSEAVAFEDSPNGIASAKAAGLYTIAYTGGSIVQDVSAADEVTASFVGFDL